MGSSFLTAGRADAEEDGEERVVGGNEKVSLNEGEGSDNARPVPTQPPIRASPTPQSVTDRARRFVIDDSVGQDAAVFRLPN